MNEAKVLLEIIRSFVRNRECDVWQEVEEEKLYQLAVKHKMSNFLVNWARKYAKSETLQQKILTDFNTQIVKDTNEIKELEVILATLEEAGIQTLVLKGIVMKAIYPQNYMRQMCDMDILIEEKNFKIASQMMKKLGYSEFYNHEKHLIFTKPPFILIELHRKLMTKQDTGYEHFEEIWSKCCPYQDYKQVVQLKKEEAYIFCVLHLMIHVKFTGIVMRDILDIYLYREKYRDCLDDKYLTQIFEKLGVKTFEEKIREIAYRWFGDEEVDDFSEVEQFILKGAHQDNRVNYQIGEKKGKFNYVLRLFFPSWEIMKEKYPILNKIPILLPIMWGTRIFKDIFSKETTLKARLNTIKLIQEAKSEAVEDIQRIYQKLGIEGKE